MTVKATSKTDVLIVGAGPAGLMLALWLARLGVDARIVDKRTDKVYSGQADGFQIRSLEILDSFGIAQRIWNESNHMVEVCFWNPDETGRICRDSRVVNGKAGLSRFHEVVLHQGRAETFFLDAIRDSYGPQQPTRGEPKAGGQAGKTHGDTSSGPDVGGQQQPRQVSVERRVMPTSLTIDEDAAAEDNRDSYPVTVALRHLSENEATPTQMLSNVQDGLFRSNLSPPDGVDPSSATIPEGIEEVVQCKYVVGCDGAHSWTRKALGPEYEMVGEMTDYIWGVLDIVPITDFPDIRNRTMIHSADNGSMMVIPRENRLVRLYIQLTEVSVGGGRVDRSQIKPDMILSAAKKIMHPYKIDYHYCDWWTAYQIGQRVGKHFSKLNRVFLAGDAVHTHSPKAGQGMNVSMQDTFNLGWKLGLVCKGVAKPSILSTYEFERKPIANQLIAFDHRFSRLFSGRPVKDILDETGVSMGEFGAAFRQSHMQFTTAVGIKYSPNMLVVGGDDEEDKKDDTGSDHKQAPSPAAACVPGMRFASHQVLRHSDARPWQLHHKMQSDGRFRLVVFGGHVSSQRDLQRADELGDWLVSHLLPKLPALAVMPGTTNLHGGGRPGHGFQPEQPPSILDVLLVYHGQENISVGEHLSFHSAYQPFDPKLGHDYDKVFVDRPSHHNGNGDAYNAYGVDQYKGAIVGVRPDGVVGLAVGLDKESWVEVENWLEGILCKAK
ncbi:phenol 2-monooxygenase [Ophiostoma piceae UAMH 11346]|uniref:Phenol 2-monooxygenase n=1 Tax=Ophiostoma piceae (strain UAMH 11346) TaxID=1262450 RepID=S3CP47_OPHP1|nr:phenol 2-monooxygenase [Ophiostoma piceae UAMH 11346]